jgi:DNA polymerase (family X)
MGGDGTRWPAEKAVALADSISWMLNEIRGVRTMVCGSIRRGRVDVGDIDLVVGNLRLSVSGIEDFCAEEGLEFGIMGKQELSPTAKRKSVEVGGIQVDLYSATDEQWGAMTLFLTGSQLFNVLTRSHAKKQGMKLSQYGLWFNDELVAGKEEKQIFDALGIQYMTPAERELRQGARLPII